MFKGITLADCSPNPQEAVTLISELKPPQLKSWKLIPNLFSPYIWQDKPPGKWVVIVRLDEWLISSSGDIPLDVDYQCVYDMLREHKAALLCRLDPDIGLIGFAVKSAIGPFTPLVPGFTASTAIDIRTLDAQGMETLVENEAAKWPEGLQKPAIIHVQAPHSLAQMEHRLSWLKQSSTGIWLVALKDEKLEIYEVLG